MIKLRQCSFILLFSLFFVQLTSISVNFSIPNFSRGYVAELLQKKIFVLEKKPEPARFAFSTKAHDSVVFTGDVMLARNVEYLMEVHGDDYPFSGISFSELDISPYVVGNFESAIPKKHVVTPKNQLKFSVQDSKIDSLFNAGFTHVSFANNHSFDYGANGLENARRVMKENLLESFGEPNKITSKSVSLLEVDENRVALLGINALDTSLTKRQLEMIFDDLETKSDFQVVYVHWGIEYDIQNSKGQRKLAEMLVEAGADLIVGHHPHVVQNVDYINGVPVFYSLGNYIFDQYFSAETETGLVLHLELDGVPRVHLLPVTSLKTRSQPRFMVKEEHQQFLSDLAKRSHSYLKDYITEGVIPLNTSVATSSKIAMMIE